MGSTKFTPGPWEVGPDIIGAYQPGKGFTRHVVAKITPARLKRQNVAAEQVAADYRLIAAAPDLLEALQACVIDMQTTEDHYGEHPRAQEVLKQARAAIAKAVGHG